MKRYCPKCNHTSNTPLHKFCPQDGTKLLDYKGGLHPKYSKPYGRWQVSTEGDCEGKTILNLGIHEGFIDEIARYLAESIGSGYSLTFARLPDQTSTDYTLAKEVKEVHITLGIDSGTWPSSMTSQQKVEAISKMMAERPVTVLDGQYYATVKLKYDK